MSGVRVGVDVGGTFTDLVAVVDGRVVTAKVPSTPADQGDGVLAALGRVGVDGPAMAAFAHGTTVATNALLERRGARTALVTTAGFRDVIEIGRQNRADLYDLTRHRPAALVPRELRFVVRERMGPDGELEPLDEDGVDEVAARLAAERVQAVAVCFLFAFLHPEHERRVGALLRERLPGVHVSLSSEVLPQVREYERFATTTANAYLAPRLGAYLGGLAGRLAQRGVPSPLVMQSSGGVVPFEVAASHAAACALSGPAAGVAAAAAIAADAGFPDVLTFDMGGTSTDVAAVVGGTARMTTEAVVAGAPIALPAVDVHTVSAGGGSIARVDEGGALRVGPRSAGAQPGPACYGRGGTAPTVTDANLVLGYLADGAHLGGDVMLERERADRALAELGAALGLTAVEAASGVLRVADAEMAQALRVITVERGLDPREFALVAFGGAGGLHACSLADELGVRRILVPRAAGVLSALGLAVSDLRRDYVRALPGELVAQAPHLEGAFAGLEAQARLDLPGAAFERLADVRYRGQSFELTVGAGDLDGLAERFHAAHRDRSGYRMDEEPLEVVHVRLVATVPVERPPLVGAPGEDRPRGGREVYADGRWTGVEVVAAATLGPGARVDGPAVVEYPEATCVVGRGWSGAVDGAGTLVLERAGS